MYKLILKEYTTLFKKITIIFAYCKLGQSFSCSRYCHFAILYSVVIYEGSDICVLNRNVYKIIQALSNRSHLNWEMRSLDP